MKKSANKALRHLAFDLREVYEILDDVCAHLAGGGIVQARDIETPVAKTLPKVRRAVNALNAISVIAEDEIGQTDDESASPGQSRHLM